MSSKVYFTNLRAKPGSNLLQKLERMVKRAGIEQIDFKDKFVAIKIHFGELGNMAYIRPNYAAVIVRIIKELGGKPFLTDSNTLYSGTRSDAVGHLHTAAVNGFNSIVTGCDVIIADGLRGKDERIVDVGGKFCPEPKIGAAIADADIVISLTHFKGHEMAGFGGALKNLGMGSGSVAGKRDMHSSAQPKVNADKCIGCRICEQGCAHDAIKVVESTEAKNKLGKLAVIDYEKCVGCGQCVAICGTTAAEMSSEESGIILNYKIDEYTKAVLKDKLQFHVAFIMNVSPECDCWAHNDAAIVPDLGMACSFDPVALDQACADLVTAAPILTTENQLNTGHHAASANPMHEEHCCCEHDHGHHEDRECCGHQHHHIGDDKFHMLHPDTNWQAGLRYAEEIGLGTREYELITM